jgi:hypothetical protein
MLKLARRESAGAFALCLGELAIWPAVVTVAPAAIEEGAQLVTLVLAR